MSFLKRDGEAPAVKMFSSDKSNYIQERIDVLFLLDLELLTTGPRRKKKVRGVNKRRRVKLSKFLRRVRNAER
jgi:hypothetical protein